jgi:hypothetical protein
VRKQPSWLLEGQWFYSMPADAGNNAWRGVPGLCWKVVKMTSAVLVWLKTLDK